MSSMGRIRSPEPIDAPLVVSRQDVLAMGMSQGAVNARLAAGHWVALAPGMFLRHEACLVLDEATDEFEQRRRAHLRLAIAAQRRRPGTVLVGGTAAILLGLPLVTGVPKVVQLSRGRGSTAHVGIRDGVRVRSIPVSPESTQFINGTEVVRPEECVIDLASYSRADGLAAADAALRICAVEFDELSRVLDHRDKGARGVRIARWVLQEANGLRETPLESLSWSRFHEWELPLPAMQSVICDDHGNFIARVDFLWAEAKVIGEADGRMKYNSPDDLYREKRREDALRSLGFTVVRWSWRDLYAGRQLLERNLRWALLLNAPFSPNPPPRTLKRS